MASDNGLITFTRWMMRQEDWRGFCDKDSEGLATVEGYSKCSSGIKYRDLNKDDIKICIGTIIDTLPFHHTYRVQTNLSAIPIVCHTMQNTLYGKHVAASCTAYSVGTDVICAYSYSYRTGVILGSFDIPIGIEDYNFRTILSGSSRKWSDDEVTQKSILINYTGDDVIGSYHANNGGIDEHTDIPEWGFVCREGTKMFADPYMILIGTDDYTGLSVFYRDSLLRLSGINYQMRTSGREEEYLNDEGEYIEYKGSSLMPYEHFGSTGKPTKDLITKNNRDIWYKPGSTIGPYEPAEDIDKISPFHRVMEWGGWLGQGHIRQIVAPPENTIILKYGDNNEFKCLAREQTGVDGHISLSSTKGISITKDGLIPAILRNYRPDDIKKSERDNGYTYKHDDIVAPKEIRKAKDTLSESMQEALGVLDYSGYNKNWRDIFQFAYHTYDYSCPEESKYKEKSIQAPDYSTLKSKLLLEEADTYAIKLDDKREYKEYSQNEAGIHLLPTGGIVIYDGSGSEIRFVKGEITISCSGDINVRPGRRANIWAGDDIVLKSKNNIEQSSSKGYVRIKAEKSLELLGGNDGGNNSGVIIESKSKSSTYDFSKMGDEIITNGIVLKSKDSPVSLIGDALFIRSGCGDNVGKGIVLDAGKGSSDIYTICNSTTEYVKNRHTINFMKSYPGDIEGTTLFSNADTLLMGKTVLTDNLTMDGTIIMSKDLAVCGTITSFGNQSGMIGPFGEQTKAKYIKFIDKNTDMPEKKYPDMLEKVYTGSLNTLIYDTNLIGNNTTLKGIGFSFRTDEQLNLPEDYSVYEDLWQHIAQNSEQDGNLGKWEETSVQCDTGITMPFPGKKAYTGNMYVTQESVFTDFNAGHYIDRKVEKESTQPSEAKYYDPEYGAQVKKSLNEYIVIK